MTVEKPALQRPSPPSKPGRRNQNFHGGSWKVAYADFVTAMMAFFLLMWILNMVPPEQKAIISGMFQGKEHGGATAAALSATPFVTPSVSPDAKSPEQARDQATNASIALKLRQMVMDDPMLQTSSGISSDDVGVLLRVNNDAMFASGSTALTREAKKVLDNVTDILADYNLYLVVRGHAGIDESGGQKFPGSWELAGSRAATAVQYILAKDPRILPSRLRAVAYGDSRPIMPDTTPENISKNRRTEFYFHRPEVMSHQVVY
ncbi:MAG: flagellar motor protein MotB [Desulfovibrionaceae bacterium]|nr:flagellar motor protein MotB [Desulfovibrionaceae bacterium]